MTLEILGTLTLAICAYAIKRYFDERAAARLVVHGISQTLYSALVDCRSEVQANTGLVKDRLTVFEKALANAIAQFAEMIKETRGSELDTRAKTAGQILRHTRRMPPP